LACLALLLAFSAEVWAKDKDKTPDTVTILSGPQASYREAVKALQKVLESRGTRCLLVELPKPDQKTEEKKVLAELTATPPQLYVGVGTQAVSLIRQTGPKVPLVFCMVPNLLDAPFWDEKPEKRTAPAGVTTDIDPKEQVAWIKKICPELKTLGIFYSPRSKKTAESLQQAGKKLGLEVVLIQTDRDTLTNAFRDLHQKDCEAVLMLPDAGIYNTTNVRALLLWGIRQKKPVFGFSESIVKAGGFAGQYCRTEDVGKQTADLVGELLKGKKADKIGLHYAKSIQRAVNVRTAEMIGIPLDETVLDDKTLRLGSDK
jgi:putative ABC transport system substrate-binding protein